MQVPAVRPPAVSGKFYPASAERLAKTLDQCFELSAAEKVSGAIACVVPHAGVMYSGHVAAAVYRRLPVRSSYVILGPNHFGNGHPLAVMSQGYWQTPLGLARLDETLARSFRERYEGLAEDAAAHSKEHSLEVQIPFLQRQSPDFTFVPVAIGAVSYAALVALGQAIAQGIRESAKEVLIVASSDMNHYEPDSITRGKDRKAIERILALDPEGLFQVLQSERITMCGYGPVVVMLTAAKRLGAREAALEKYATSADAGGDWRSVVGYAGIIIR